MPEPDTADDAADEGATWPLIAGLVVLGGAAAWYAARVLRRRHRHRHGSHRHDVQVADAWSDAVRMVQPLDLQLARHETPTEFAARVAARVHRDLLGELAAIETQRRYAAGGASAEDAARAERAAAAVGEFVKQTTTRGQRVAALVGRSGD